MSNFWGKAPSSRPTINQTIQYAGDKASYPTTAFSNETWRPYLEQRGVHLIDPAANGAESWH
jgi:hypothetical protein